MDWTVPTLADVLDARDRISAYLRPTPLYRYPAIDQRLAAEVFIKHENHQPVGAFKVRGGINLISRLDADERSRGVITASTGNHGQSVAYAARLFGVPATICVPEKANPVKVASMRALGAEVVFYGENFDVARLHAEQLARDDGRRFVHTANEPLLIAGVGTATLEILEDQPRTEVIIVPVGGGHGAAAACIVAKAISPQIKVIGVQSREAPAAYRSWRERRLVEDKVETFAEGLATGTAFEFTQRILWDLLDDFVLVSDDEIATAQALLIEMTRNLVEAAGAASFAAALQLSGQLTGKRVALMVTGGNASPDQIIDVLTRQPPGGVMDRDADLVLTGGAVYPVDAARSWAQAVAVRDGRIAAVGSDADMRPHVGTRTEVVSLRGRMVLPGFQDAHVHVSGGGLERNRCDLTGVHTRQDYLAVIRDYADRNPEAEWITGGGWSMDVFPGGVPSKDDLDEVIPDRPVFLSNRDHHGAWVNSRALALAGLDAATPDPPDGRIERGAAGEPSGTLHEGAMNLMQRLVPAPGLEEQVAGILAGQRYLHSLGITAWQEAIVGDYAVVPDCFDAYREVEGRGLLTARVTGALWWQRAAGLGQLDFLAERRAVAGQGRFRATSVKIMQDGVCENFTAAMLAPYLDGHGHPTGGRGTSFFDPEELTAAVTAIDAQGFQVHIHAIGDRAVREALDAIAAAQAANGASGARGGEVRASSGSGRHHIAHLQVVHPDDLPRFRDLGVLANCQPLWASNEPQMTELTLPFLGPERSAWQYPFGSLARSGAQLCFGSDWPVSSPDPMWEMHTAVNRTTAPGYPFRGPQTDTPFLPEERVGLPTAIAAFTIGSAYVNHDEHEAGSVEPGKRADLVVLDRDLFAQPAAEIALAQVDLTLVDGAVVHARPGA